jgi:hypothetical protein
MKQQEASRKNLLQQHGSRLTRRDLFALGLLTAGGMILNPRARATSGDLEKLDRTAKIPYLAFDLIGGAALPGSFLVGGPGGALDLIGSYDQMGWNPRTEQIDYTFGAPMAPRSVSGISRGLDSVLSPGARERLRFGCYAHTSRDDTSDNPMSILKLIASAQSPVSGIGVPLGTRPSKSGGGSRSLFEIDSITCLEVTHLETLLSTATLQGSLTHLGDDRLSGLTRSIQALSRLEGQRLLPQSSQTHLASSYATLSTLRDEFDFDPRQHSDAASLYGLTAQTDMREPKTIRAAIASAVIAGASGPGVIGISGCDYHDGTSTTGDAKDFEIGQEIGRAVELAHRRSMPLFLHLYSDGGVSALRGSRKWLGDDGEKSLTVVGFYDPQGPLSYRHPTGSQIGHYLSGQGASRETFVGDGASRAAYGAFANYLSICGRVADFERYFPRLLRPSELESLIFFS